MKTDPITGLREADTSDGTLRAELLAAASFEEAAALAARRGWAVTAAEIEVLAREFTLAEGELSEAELESISGGFCPISNIMKTKHDTVKNTISNVR